MNYFITFKNDFHLNKLLLDASTDCCSYGQMTKHATGKITVKSRGKSEIVIWITSPENDILRV
jgi:hypothetical protein